MHTTTRVRATPRRGFVSPTRLPSISFSEFRTRYTDECLCFLAVNTQSKVAGILDSIESILKPQSIEDLDAAAISRWSARRKGEGIADATLKGCLAHLKSALNWAREQGMISEVPVIRTPPRAKGQRMMKGRPITQAEFERMRLLCESDSQRFFLDGLWYSGLRLSEALSLSWDAGSLSIDLSGEFPMFRIPANMEKGNQDRLLPMSPEFASLLSGVPQDARTGFVFPMAQRRLVDVSRGISAIGEAAGVVVDARSGKFASAHDLRRSFGERWASRVMPAILMQLMRHESIETTMRFYVGQNAQEVARQCWEALK